MTRPYAPAAVCAALAALVLPVCAVPALPDAAAGFAQTGTQPPAQNAPWENEIRAFEAQDKARFPPSDAALFIGSSSIRLWKTLASDFPEISTINRGFGGSQIADSTQFVERIVVPYKPRLIVMYAGTNDINAGKTPEQVRDDFDAFVTKVRASLPDVPIVYISMNPAMSRWNQRERVQEGNRLIADYVRQGRKLVFLNSYPVFLGPDGMPQSRFYVADNLHLSPDGYALWKATLKPAILSVYRQSKPAK